jgi:hypothetical protein
MEQSEKNQHNVMKLTTYVDLVRTYFQNQKASVRKLGYCYGWGNQIFHYNNVQEYKENVKSQIQAMIDCGELVTDIELSEALDILEKPELKIYKK